MKAAATANHGLMNTLWGIDSLPKAELYRSAGLALTVIGAFTMVGAALLLKTVHLSIFIALGLGGFCTFVSVEIRRRLAVEATIDELRREVQDLRARVKP